jgi:hypothetical protein
MAGFLLGVIQASVRPVVAKPVISDSSQRTVTAFKSSHRSSEYIGESTAFHHPCYCARKSVVVSAFQLVEQAPDLDLIGRRIATPLGGVSPIPEKELRNVEI